MTTACIDTSQAPVAMVVTKRRSAMRQTLVFLNRILFWPVRVAQARRDMAMLGAMSDHELSDIGLSRQDVHNAASLALDEGPASALAEAADRRWRRNR